MDDNGAIYFVVKDEKSAVVKVLRVDPKMEMGNVGFIKPVFSLRCQDIHFLEIKDKQFYLMDEKKKIRVLTQNEETFQLTLKTTLEVNSKAQQGIKHSDFDDFAMSSYIIQWKSQMMYLHE